jgi:dUTP pyrophosphatase
MEIKIFKMHADSKIPTKGSEKAAAYDVYAYVEEGAVTIKPHESVKIGTGLKIAPPEGYFVAIYARSGLASKEGLRPSNCVGICDEDYRGEYIVAVHNDSNNARIIRHGERIAQIVLQKRYDMDFDECDSEEELGSTKRGEGGFGSTGK